MGVRFGAGFLAGRGILEVGWPRLAWSHFLRFEVEIEIGFRSIELMNVNTRNLKLFE